MTKNPDKNTMALACKETVSRTPVLFNGCHDNVIQFVNLKA